MGVPRISVTSQMETPKRYRYTGKERDEENDLYYHGARYYAPWLARWVSCDPDGLRDGTDPYSYARNSPPSSKTDRAAPRKGCAGYALPEHRAQVPGKGRGS